MFVILAGNLISQINKCLCIILSLWRVSGTALSQDFTNRVAFYCQIEAYMLFVNKMKKAVLICIDY